MNKKNTADKSLSRTVSLPESIWEKLQSLAEQKLAGNRSRYLSNLIQADFLGTQSKILSPESENPLIELATKFAPALTSDIGRWCENYAKNQAQQPNQSRLIVCLLQGLIDSGTPHNSPVNQPWKVLPESESEKLEKEAIYNGFESGYRWALLDILRYQGHPEIIKLVSRINSRFKLLCPRACLEYEALPSALKGYSSDLRESFETEAKSTKTCPVRLENLLESVKAFALEDIETVIFYWEALRYTAETDFLSKIDMPDCETKNLSKPLKPKQMRAIIIQWIERIKASYFEEAQGSRFRSYPIKEDDEKLKVAEDGELHSSDSEQD